MGNSQRILTQYKSGAADDYQRVCPSHILFQFLTWLSIAVYCILHQNLYWELYMFGVSSILCVTITLPVDL